MQYCCTSSLLQPVNKLIFMTRGLWFDANLVSVVNFYTCQWTQLSQYTLRLLNLLFYNIIK